jgi:mevalonate pyrophosphate decarboxylase
VRPTSWWIGLTARVRVAVRSEDGMTTAELLGNAALGIAALVAIWAVLQALGLDIVNWIRGQLGV